MKRALSIIGIGAAFGALLTLTSALSLWSRCRAASEQLYGTFDRVDPVLEGC